MLNLVLTIVFYILKYRFVLVSLVIATEKDVLSTVQRNGFKSNTVQYSAELEKAIFLFSLEVFGIKIWWKKRVNYDKLEIFTKLRKLLEGCTQTTKLNKAALLG